MITLKDLGKKICIIGCSSSGKSTLADKLSTRLNIPAYHLDQLAHYEDTKWLRKSDKEFIKAHNQILNSDAWIIDGNYSVCMAERIKNASSIIWLDTNVLTSAWRYIKRSLRNNPNRTGGLPGAKNEFRLFMLKQILFVYPKNRKKYQTLINKSGKRIIFIQTMNALNQYYALWNL